MAGGYAQQLASAALFTGSDAASAATPAVRDTPSSDRELEFVGSYGANGRFRRQSHEDCLSGRCDDFQDQDQRFAEIPPWADLHDSEQRVENFAPRVHVTKSWSKKSRSGSILESVLAFAYGREPLLRAPTYITTDSQKRVIVSDPQAPGVHVLNGSSSFLISAGPSYRLKQPRGVAVDGQDQIYVADAGSGTVLVFDRDGRYSHTIGNFQGESMFTGPVGVAIDRENNRVYVLDGHPGELIALDLNGKVLRRVGGSRRLGQVHFEEPSEIAVRGSRVVVLDSFNSRIQVFDLQCHRLNEFPVRAVSGRPRPAGMGLALDDAGNIYVNAGSSGIKAYRQDGQLVGTFGQISGGHDTPVGFWIDSPFRLYIADARGRRILVYSQVRSSH